MPFFALPLLPSYHHSIFDIHFPSRRKDTYSGSIESPPLRDFIATVDSLSKLFPAPQIAPAHSKDLSYESRCDLATRSSGAPSSKMLLPSAIPCESLTSALRPPSHQNRRPLMSPPPPASQSTSTRSRNIYSACYALQSLLGSRNPLQCASAVSAPQRLNSPIHFEAPLKGQRSAVKVDKNRRYPSQVTQVVANVPSRKRRRSSTSTKHPFNDYENKENKTSGPTAEATRYMSGPSTPKRNKHRCPPSLPRGLDEEDFENLPVTPIPLPRRDLSQPHTPFRLQPDINFLTPSAPAPLLGYAAPVESEITPKQVLPSSLPPLALTSPISSTSTQMSTEDSALLRLILSKLNLRPEDWDDTARQMGPYSSISQRWQSLLEARSGVDGHDGSLGVTGDTSLNGDGGAGAGAGIVMRRGRGLKKRGSLMDLDLMARSDYGS